MCILFDTELPDIDAPITNAQPSKRKRRPPVPAMSSEDDLYEVSKEDGEQTNDETDGANGDSNQAENPVARRLHAELAKPMNKKR
jgi:hypothetical protein